MEQPADPELLLAQCLLGLEHARPAEPDGLAAPVHVLGGLRLHEAGDDVLRRVAAVLAESVRLVDTVGRIGGDEFVLVAPGSAGMMVAQRIINGIADLPALAGRRITVSAGVARFPVDGSDSAALIAAATEGLERARAEGRGTLASGVAPQE